MTRPTTTELRAAAARIGISLSAVHRRRYVYGWTWAEAMTVPRGERPRRLRTAPPPERVVYPRAARMLGLDARWIAAERLEPDAGTEEHAAWLAELSVTRPVAQHRRAA